MSKEATLSVLADQGSRPSIGWRVAWTGLAVLSSVVALVSYRYLAGVGPLPPNIIVNRHVSPWIVIHAAGAATALLVGPWQFVPALRRRRPVVHRTLGRVYVAGCATGGVTALVLATGVSTGPIAGTGFAALGTAWITTTTIAVREVLAGRVPAHRRWMIRSFALTLSAVTLRIYLPLTSLIGLDFAISYPVIAWACWLPNLIAAELFIGAADA
jgi:uncharacterized membrane protein